MIKIRVLRSLRISNRRKASIFRQRGIIVDSFLRGKQIKDLAATHKISLMQMTRLLWLSGVIRTKIMGRKIILLNGWSKKVSRCIQCRTKDTPHRGHGLCASCFSRIYSKKITHKKSIWYLNNAERERERQKIYRENNQAYWKQRIRKWRLKNKDHVTAYTHTYRLANPDKPKETDRYRRNWGMKLETVTHVINRDKKLCRYCGVLCFTNGDQFNPRHLTIHHITPLSICVRIGMNPNTKQNLVVACLRCNLRIHVSVVRPNEIGYMRQPQESILP